MHLPSTAVATEYRFSGDIDPAVFATFAEARIRRLSLRGACRIAGGTVVCRVAGPLDLVDMFEMACLVGPAGCLVTTVERRPAPMVRAA
jgi:hypothetical protein